MPNFGRSIDANPFQNPFSLPVSNELPQPECKPETTPDTEPDSAQVIKDFSKKEDLRARSDGLDIRYNVSLGAGRHTNNIICDFVGAQADPCDLPQSWGRFEECDFLYINGIMTDAKLADQTRDTLTDLIGKPVTCVYNPTHGLLMDGPEAVRGMTTSTVANSIDRSSSWAIYSTLKEGKGVKIICHSQGAAITANALNECKRKLLHDGMPPEQVAALMANCQVLALGHLSSIQDFPKEVSVLQMADEDDPVAAIAYNPTGFSTDDLTAHLTRARVASEGRQSCVGKLNVALTRHVAVPIVARLVRDQRVLTSGAIAVAEFVKATNKWRQGENPIASHGITDNYLKSPVVTRALREFSEKDLSDIDARAFNRDYQATLTEEAIFRHKALNHKK
ncbi:MAG: hypothetical protein ACAI44_40625 [Candidatus Sericytochromatia bacterium]